jgi:Uma2 family endonuclease
MAYQMEQKDLQDILKALEKTPAIKLELNQWGNGTIRPSFDGEHSQEEILKQLLEAAKTLRKQGFTVEVLYQYLKRSESRYKPYPHGKVSRRYASPDVVDNRDQEEVRDA